MDQLIEQFFNTAIMREAWPIMWRGLLMTLLLCLTIIPAGLIGGLFVAFASSSRYRLLRWTSIVYVDLFRAIPPLVLLIFIYSALPFAGIKISPFLAVVLAFFLNNSSFYGEIYRAGLESVGAGQWQAARSTGLTQMQTLFYVIVPQAVRNVLPDLATNTLEVVKLTALASVVSFSELLYSADMARSVTYNASPITMAAIMYLILMLPLVRLVSRLERRVASH